MNSKDARKASAAMRSQIDAALAQVVANNPKLVRSLKIKTIRFNEDGFRTTLECEWTDGLTPEQRMYDSFKGVYNLPERGTTFVSTGHVYTIDGMKTKRRFEWVVAHDSKNTSWLFRPDDVVRLLKINPKVADFTIEI